MERTELKENRMGTEPIKGLLIKMSLPLVASMLVQSLYNVVDSIFVSRINEDALTAVSMCFPIQMLSMAAAVGTAIGMSAMLSRYLGAKQFDRAVSVGQNGLFLAVCGYIVVALIGFGAHAFMSAQTQHERIVLYGTQYMQIACWLSIFVFLQVTFERFLQATGKTFYILIVQGTGAVINIIFDPIFIFGLLGAPRMGVAGAAYATVLGQGCGALLGFIINLRKNPDVKLDMRGFRPNMRDIKDIYKIGVPAMVMQCVGSILVFFMNHMLLLFSTTAVATYGIYFKLQSFVFMPVFGLNNGVVPIIAYNYGAGRRERMEEAMKLALRYGMTIMLIGTAVCWLIPSYILAMFDASPKMVEIGVPALRIMSLVFPCAGYAIMRGSAFQALGKSVYSMIASLARQLGVILPAAYLLAQLGNIDYIWWAYPIAEIVGVFITMHYTKKIRRDIIDKI